jgi:hypothetical protein
MSVSKLFKEEMMVVLKKVVKDICVYHDLDYMEECRRLDMVDLDVVSEVVKAVKVVSEVVSEVVKEVVTEVKEAVNEKPYRGRFPLPYNGEMKEECCIGLTHNYGLMTQCYSKKKVGEEYCGNCKNKADKEANGMPAYGNIKERMKVGIEEYVAPNGERPEKYLAVLKKLNLSKERALEEASKMNMKIADVHLVGVGVISVSEVSVSAPKNDKKGRGKSEVKKADKPVPVGEVKASRGRPKKEVSDVKLDEEVDYFAQAIAEYEADKEVEKVAEKVAEKEVEKVAEEEEEEEEEEIQVIRIEYEGKKYLKSSQGVVYDAFTQDEIGEWDPKLEKVVFFPVEEEEEDEYDSE